MSATTIYDIHHDVALTWQITEAITAIMELRDPFTVRHQWRVAQLAETLGSEWGIGDSYLEGLRAAALVHDIGKMAIPLEILYKPGKLNEEECNIIKTHPQAGYNTLNRINFPWPVAEIVLQHHEQLDGSGYPRGLDSQDIFPETKVLAVANVVDAMIHHKPYRAAHSLEAAMEEISTNKENFYDPEVVDICIELFTKRRFNFNLD